MKKGMLFLLAATLGVSALGAAEVVKLPEPTRDGGMSLMQAIQERRTGRSFDAGKPLTQQQIANLLWAACGQNRPSKITIPTTRNSQDIRVYAVLPDGVYLYQSKSHTLQPVLTGDHRTAMAEQADLVAAAGMVLVYVSDSTKFGRITPEKQRFFAAAHTGSAYQNVHLVCAAENLSAVVIDLINRTKIAELLKLPSWCSVQITQAVGVPAAE